MTLDCEALHDVTMHGLTIDGALDESSWKVRAAATLENKPDAPMKRNPPMERDLGTIVGKQAHVNS